ncbi:MAG: alpha/beta hydrolase [Parvularculaceae bacterium]|nr:alpha/beta hydrolase [Parvularculaceae bacterium]
MPRIEMSDGALLRVDDVGAGRPFLLAHGWAMAASLFAPLAEALAADHRVVAPDLRGHAGSASAKTVSLEMIAEDLATLAERLDLQDVVAVGWSMGAMALWTASFARRVTAFVVVDMSPRIVNDSAWRLGLKDGRDLEETIAAADAMRADWPAAVRRFAPRIAAPDAGADLLLTLENVALEQDAVTMAGLWESLARQDARAALARLSAPTLAVYGEQSQLYDAASSRFVAEASPNGRAVGFRHSGHAPHLEEPERFVATLLDFAAATSNAAAPPRRVGSVH